ncbi:MAG: hypothetical protein HUU55_08795 [Myxococcales bacterium]|nr:hypothetical protein [Myxococcales bacterium]
MNLPLTSSAEAKRKAMQGLYTYLESHKTMMEYPRYRQEGYPVASSAIESANKRIVSRRCKQGGMIWTESGLTAMLALRVAFYNRCDWQRHWKHLDASQENA